MEKLQKLVDKVNKIFKEQSCGFSAEVMLEIPNAVCIDIDGGDWKHDHGYADYVMSQNGFQYITEKVTEETDSDWYSSIHYYLMK